MYMMQNYPHVHEQCKAKPKNVLLTCNTYVRTMKFQKRKRTNISIYIHFNLILNVLL